MLIKSYRKIYFQKISEIAEGLQSATGIVRHAGQDLSEETVHVVMPGASCLNTVSRIPSADVVIGFNFSGLLPIKYDYIFIENANASEYSDIQYNACVYHAAYGARTLIKNIWMPARLSVPRLLSYSGFSEFVLDVPLRPKVLVNDLLARRWLVNTKYAYSSFMSSTFFALSYLYASGCNNIVIHGVDFGGPYFWEITRDVCIDDDRVRNYKGGDAHGTERGRNPFSKLLAELVDELRSRGVRVEAANTSGALRGLL